MQQGNTKERIVEAYIELESERPLEKITVTALVERSRITRKTFYYYFKDIYAVSYTHLDVYKRQSSTTARAHRS